MLWLRSEANYFSDPDSKRESIDYIWKLSMESATPPKRGIRWPEHRIEANIESHM